MKIASNHRLQSTQKSGVAFVCFLCMVGRFIGRLNRSVDMTHRDDIEEDLRNLWFDFLYWFSRFAFALKENGRIHAGHRGVAQADWNSFIRDCVEDYQPCDVAQRILGSPPEVQ
jgi:hypothetical protein